ncbi:MAG: hypothetical protein ACK5HR_04485 [Mycoplasmatales bacterium]
MKTTIYTFSYNGLRTLDNLDVRVNTTFKIDLSTFDREEEYPLERDRKDLKEDFKYIMGTYGVGGYIDCEPTNDFIIETIQRDNTKSIDLKYSLELCDEWKIHLINIEEVE